MTEDIQEPTPVPNAALVNTLAVVAGNLRSNRNQLVRQAEELTLQLGQNAETTKQFDAMIHALNLIIDDPFAVQTVADKLLADEKAAAEVPAAPLTGAGSTGESVQSAEGYTGPVTEISSSDGDVGVDANGSPVANDSGNAS